MLLALPTGYADEEVQGLSPLLEAQEAVLVTTVLAAASHEEDDEATDGAAPKKRKAQTKAGLQAQLAERDPYKLLELDDLRWRASADDIKKAHRRMVLKHHPDKAAGAEAAAAAAAGGGGGEGETGAEAAADDGEGDEMFKAVTEAFELLSDPKRRRDFDSLDDFDDSIPPKDFDARTHGDFFAVFGPVFERNSRWSEVANAPLLGDAETPFDSVANFYNFWFEFRSWRDFADADEYDLDDAGFREEKRYAGGGGGGRGRRRRRVRPGAGGGGRFGWAREEADGSAGRGRRRRVRPGPGGGGGLGLESMALWRIRCPWGGLLPSVCEAPCLRADVRCPADTLT